MPFSLKQAAHDVLRGRPPLTDAGKDERGRPSTTLLAHDMSVHGNLGFVLLVHRRRDGAAAEELYWSVREADGVWAEPEHLSGGLTGADPDDMDELADVLRGEPLMLVSDAETLLCTGRRAYDDGYESVRFAQILTAARVRSVEVERLGPGTRHTTRRPAPYLLTLLVALPGESLRVRATGSDGPVIRFDGIGPGTSV
ncbi:hypothetical protein PZB75_29405 [Streptomyces sp. AM 4-1-1]|uniref:hypothetical protein n=1 Tax=Streptomyces sp. AM 4-1-1 TaxID=3028710 RepID=UPI0023B8CD93|nr:hypothetical protein [Streptomyces sp. AM 4-1-1]WEH37119.1 hypothetical protein PZB75_29405 [Streptomyces sp. AM 4-1-1]